MRPERLELGAKQQHPTADAVVQRFFTHPVARQRQRAGFVVPYGKGKHSIGTLKSCPQPPKRDPSQ